eukprot:TRINITY_DN15025_c0_g1_i4.p1 TRINITY_DN15025_c0_g1~~TRINITY_DN15025_c0_g1_i4.p1  ORF type:complete len:332 (-),score=70.45 TRINITY_DN15025_c0_g1_i4:180-1175(-)
MADPDDGDGDIGHGLRHLTVSSPPKLESGQARGMGLSFAPPSSQLGYEASSPLTINPLRKSDDCSSPRSKAKDPGTLSTPNSPASSPPRETTAFRKTRSAVAGPRKYVRKDFIGVSATKSLERSRSTPTFFQRVKKNAVLSLATSTNFGKSTVLALLPTETQNLVKALTAIVEKESGDTAAARGLESNLVKFLVNIGLEKEMKNLRLRDFHVADPPLREAFNILCRLFSFYNDGRKRNLTAQFERCERCFVEVADRMITILQEFCEPQDCQRVLDIFGHVGTAEFLARCWANPNLEDELYELFDSMNRYTCFHYHWEEMLANDEHDDPMAR